MRIEYIIQESVQKEKEREFREFVELKIINLIEIIFTFTQQKN